MKTIVAEQFHDQYNTGYLISARYNISAQKKLSILKTACFTFITLTGGALIFLSMLAPLYVIPGIVCCIVVVALLISKSIKLNDEAAKKVLREHYGIIANSKRELSSGIRKVRIDVFRSLLESYNLYTVKKVDYLINDYSEDLKEIFTSEKLERIAPISTIIALFALCITIIGNKELASARGFITLPIIIFVLWALLMRMMIYGPFFGYDNKISRAKDLIRYLKHIRVELLSKEQ
jgi:hypothetical protein